MERLPTFTASDHGEYPKDEAVNPCKEKIERILKTDGFKTAHLEHIRQTLNEYPLVTLRFFRIEADPFLKDKGEFTGGIGKGEGGTFVIRIRKNIAERGNDRLFNDTFNHEWGHAIHQQVIDGWRFFKAHGLDMPE